MTTRVEFTVYGVNESELTHLAVRGLLAFMDHGPIADYDLDARVEAETADGPAIWRGIVRAEWA